MNEEQKKICHTVDEFAEEMKKRLLKKYDEGYRGWDVGGVKNWQLPERLYSESLDVYRKLGAEDSFVYTKQLINIANFAMMLWNKRGKRMGEV